jgi:RNA polymerase sigma factor (sigma-70 family)
VTSAPHERESAASGTAGPRGPAAFAPTRWTMVLQAGRGADTAARDALERLCATYWFPLYAYVRRRGFAAHDAQDLTQGFFARILERRTLAHADPGRGRFRSFMLAALKHFIADEWEKARAAKRGGGRELVSLDFAAAEQRLDLEPVDPGAAPDDSFDRRWALALLDEVLRRLEEEFRQDGRAAQFAALKQTLTSSGSDTPYAELAVRLGTNEGAVKVSVHRLRKRYRALLEQEIRDTVATVSDAKEEMRHLLRALTGG